MVIVSGFKQPQSYENGTEGGTGNEIHGSERKKRKASDKAKKKSMHSLNTKKDTKNERLAIHPP